MALMISRNETAMSAPEDGSHQDDLFIQNHATDVKMRRLFEYVAAALHEGSSSRRALPLEVVRGIFFCGGFTVPAPQFSIHTEVPFSSTANSGDVKRQSWIISEPFDIPSLSRVGSVRLSTCSRHQGWVSLPDHGSWSWFELAIVSQDTGGLEDGTVSYDCVKKRPDRTKLAWLSHRHPIEEGRDIGNYRGMTFNAEHEVWTHLSPGDRLAVFGCAQFPGWKCIGESAALQFDEFFDPTRWTDEGQ